ncbi:hypothetical protein JTB14_003293 [Gonioctena quinquepunctata]|nr:hypothetical protein JTB14_003293 [Gonioctena quinquepunctata]
MDIKKASSCRVLTERALSQGSCIGRKRGLNDSAPSPAKCQGVLIVSPQSLPPKPSGQMHLNIAQPSMHLPPFLHGPELQNDLFSGHPAVVPLSVTKVFKSKNS